MTNADEVKYRFARHTEQWSGAGGSDAFGGGAPPPTGGDMESRISKLEAVIPTLVTKADLESLRTALAENSGTLQTDFERGQKDNRTWMLGTVIALFVGILAMGNFLATNLVKRDNSPPQAVSPIVIQVPTYTAQPSEQSKVTSSRDTESTKEK